MSYNQYICKECGCFMSNIKYVCPSPSESSLFLVSFHPQNMFLVYIHYSIYNQLEWFKQNETKKKRKRKRSETMIWKKPSKCTVYFPIGRKGGQVCVLCVCVCIYAVQCVWVTLANTQMYVFGSRAYPVSVSSGAYCPTPLLKMC